MKAYILFLTYFGLFLFSNYSLGQLNGEIFSVRTYEYEIDLTNRNEDSLVPKTTLISKDVVKNISGNTYSWYEKADKSEKKSKE